jgi:hypothetical protein
VLGDIDSAHHHRAACHALRQASDAPSAA